jgi:CBS domain-containing protein
MDMMAAHHVRRLLVRNADGATTGWITLSDISRRLLIDSPIVRDGLRELNRVSA